MTQIQIQISFGFCGCDHRPVVFRKHRALLERLFVERRKTKIQYYHSSQSQRPWAKQRTN